MAHPNLSLPISAAQGKLLVALARETIARKLDLPRSQRTSRNIAAALKDPIFEDARATFVTLTKAGRLRGCIGSLQAKHPLKDDVRHNALRAAFQDPRFPPLKASELAQVEIEVSILSEAQLLDYADGEDLLQRLQPRLDGVIIQQGMAGATFLPQVWAQLPRPEDFLGHLCRKAGLPETAWQTGNLKVETYRVQYFKEDDES